MKGKPQRRSCLIGPASDDVCGTFSWLQMMKKDPAHCGWCCACEGGPGLDKKGSEQAEGKPASKQHSSKVSVSASASSFLSKSLSWWWTVMWKRKPNKPFPPKLVLWQRSEQKHVPSFSCFCQGLLHHTNQENHAYTFCTVRICWNIHDVYLCWFQAKHKFFQILGAIQRTLGNLPYPWVQSTVNWKHSACTEYAQAFFSIIS